MAEERLEFGVVHQALRARQILKESERGPLLIERHLHLAEDQDTLKWPGLRHC